MKSMRRSRPRKPRAASRAAKAVFSLVVLQIVAVDLVFSVDSIVTAIGMAKDIEVMIIAVVLAMIVMYVASGPVAHFIAHHPTTKMLALAFLVMIGVALVADGFEFHIPRGYIYSSHGVCRRAWKCSTCWRAAIVRARAPRRQQMREKHQ